MSKKVNVLYIHFGLSSFIKEDLKILDEFSEVFEFQFEPSRTFISLLVNYIKQFFWVLKCLPKADMIYCWFSDYHAILPLLFSKISRIPFITVLGGVDCNKLPALNYGIFCSWWRAPIGTLVLKNSTLLIPVDKHLIETDSISEYWPESHPNGVKNNVRNFNTKWKTVPTGYHSDAWASGNLSREKIVSTVALCSNHRTALIKGWDLFIKVAKFLPDYKFIAVGATPEFAKELEEKYKPSQNVEFIPPLNQKDLENIYKSTSVYLQLSRAEGLPNVLCEAMLCECVPVGSPVFGIPDAIGATGFIAPKPDVNEIAELVQQAHSNATILRPQARNHILKKYSIEQRKYQLKKIFSNILAK